MARKPNYDFEKRKKEMERKAKKDEKLRRKREDAENGVEPAEDESMQISAEDAEALGLVRPAAPPQE